MYGKELGKDALTIFCPQTGDSHCRFSIFFCGCKQPKSIHILNSAAKVRLSEHNTKGKTIFFTFIAEREYFRMKLNGKGFHWNDQISLHSYCFYPFLPLPPPPFLNKPNWGASTTTKSTSSTSVHRHRRHRQTDIDDVDSEAVEERKKRRRVRTLEASVIKSVDSFLSAPHASFHPKDRGLACGAHNTPRSNRSHPCEPP